jgi:hypothetical protein
MWTAFLLVWFVEISHLMQEAFLDVGLVPAPWYQFREIIPSTLHDGSLQTC